MEYSEENILLLNKKLCKLTGKELDISFLVVLDPYVPYIYQQAGKYAQVKHTVHHYGGKVVKQTPDEIRVNNHKDFLETFVYLEFFINQLLKILVIDTFNLEQWEKLEVIIGGKYIRFEDKKELIKKFNPELWEKVKPHLMSLQKLRNVYAHNPIGPIQYCNKPIDWELIDKHISIVNDNILDQYKKLQAPLLDMIKEA